MINKTPNSEKENKWILIRDGEVRGIFSSRRQAVAYFKKSLKQTMEDFEKQDKTDEYTYPIIIPRIEIKPINERPFCMSLL